MKCAIRSLYLCTNLSKRKRVAKLFFRKRIQKLMKKYIFLFLSIGFLFSACDKDNVKKDREIIQEYLDEKGLTATETDSGLFYIIEEEGTGELPIISDNVEVKYIGSFTDDSIFDQTTGNTTATFPLTNVIPGFREGILLTKKGGKTKLLLPSNIGYGSNAPAGIPNNSVLIFDVELVDF